MKKALGFTLSELLIVLLILSIVLIASISIFKDKIDKTDKIAYYSGYIAASNIAVEVVQTSNNSEEITSLCNMLATVANVSNYSCGTFSVTDNSDFTKLTPNIVLNNGVKIYIQKNNVEKISEISKESNVLYGHVIYIDVDGEKGASKYNKDVCKFYILTNGIAVPAGDLATNKNMLSFDILYDSFSGSTIGAELVLKNSLSFQQAICKAGIIPSETSYCAGTAIEATCAKTGSNCQIRAKRPYKGLRE